MYETNPLEGESFPGLHLPTNEITWVSVEPVRLRQWQPLGEGGKNCQSFAVLGIWVSWLSWPTFGCDQGLWCSYCVPRWSLVWQGAFLLLGLAITSTGLLWPHGSRGWATLVAGFFGMKAAISTGLGTWQTFLAAWSALNNETWTAVWE